MISQNLGIMASMRGDLVGALDHYGASLVTYRAAGLRQHLGPVLNNMGLVYTQLDRLDEAQAAYDEALVHCDADRRHDASAARADQLDAPLDRARRHRPRGGALQHGARPRRRPSATSARSPRRTSTSA